ncbi:hypothetical protein PIB30_040152 [Stylosanthes scabra]|uniref:Uncharacterized protein n=1 Tax=Stylosanthes scabra TaxID=79078 RepID=A0ABU6VDA6_9FABA|nr:hypothetical protein [Stylosanthes scabra]
MGDVLQCTTPKSQDVHFPTINNTGTLVPINTPWIYRFSPPPVPLKIQQLDSQQQPTLGLD